MARLILTVTNDLICDQRMYRIASSLVKAGHVVTLVGRVLPESAPLRAQGYEQQRLRCWFRRGFLFYAEYNLRLFAWLLRQPADAFGAVDLDTLLAVCAAGVLRQMPVVFDAHEYFTEVPELSGRPIVKWVWTMIGRLCVPFCRQAYTVGPMLADIFSRQYRRPFGVVRNVPLAQREPLALPPVPPPFVLLYQGALNEGRGVEALLEAMRHLPNTVLWLAGEGDLSASLRQKAAQLALGERVRFLGRLHPEKLRALTPKAWLGVNLMDGQQSLSYYYSLANKFFDYVQAGVPVLTMNFPEYRALNTQYAVAHLIGELSPAAIVEAVRYLQENPDAYQRLRQATLQARTAWVWEREEPTLLALWSGALGSG